LFNQLEFAWESSKEGNFSAPLTSLVSLARINPIEDWFLGSQEIGFPSKKAEAGRKTIPPAGNRRQRKK
jgi:hypothetical protein